MQCRLKKVSDNLLYVSVGIATTIFIITLVVVVMGEFSSELNLSITLELMWAVIDTVVSLSLVGIGFFAVYKLTSVFGDHFNKEALFVSVISVVFCLGYLIHGIYDWVIYSKWKNGLMFSKRYKIWAEMIWLSIVWTLLPVLTIYLMHRKNFKSQD
jgi:hypothetical protein